MSTGYSIPTNSTRDRFHELFRKKIARQFGVPIYPQVLQCQFITLLVRKGVTRETIDAYLMQQQLEKLAQEFTTNNKLQVRAIDAANYSLEDQVKIFASTRILVADHGAGMSNMVFMPPHGAVIEIWHVGGDYFRPLADIMQLHYQKIHRNKVLQTGVLQQLVRRAITIQTRLSKLTEYT